MNESEIYATVWLVIAAIHIVYSIVKTKNKEKE